MMENWPALALTWLALAAPARGDDDGPEPFRTTVGPALKARCLRCHSGAKPKGGLSIATRADLMRGGNGGPAIEPGDPEASPLLEQVTGDEPAMPAQGPPLAADLVEAIRGWIAAGAPWPESIALADLTMPVGDWWSLRPLARPAVPAVGGGWTRNPIDAFILARLNAENLTPRPEADRRTLIRRLTFDLIGLPPTPEEVDAFLADESPDAYERVVDRLLASPHHGERWGRHWLDVARYGDSHGYDKDKRRDHAWRYRDYVINAFNNDIPYDTFIRQQIAGDTIAPDDPASVSGSGFLAAGPWDFVGQVELAEGTVEKEKTRLLDRDDMVVAVGGAFLGLTVGCARCHDHKFDPIAQADYYRLQAVFSGVDRGDRPLPDPSAAATEPGSMAYGLIARAPRPIRVLDRGEVERPGAEARPGALACIPGLPAEMPAEATGDEGARRAWLADWVADARNPLPWRSMANRLWQHHYGRPLVDTPNDFGRNGAEPSHPELLDWLAAELRDGDRRLKPIHRLIVTSATYRQDSGTTEAALRADSGNRFLARQNRRRLDAESLRDSVLAVAGTLDRTLGGPPYEPFRFKDDHSPIYDHRDPSAIVAPSTWRRAVYRFTVRSVPDPFLECLDAADPNASTPMRSATITAPQALALLNDPFLVRQTSAFAARIEALAPGTPGRIDAAFRLAIARSATDNEQRLLAAYADKHGLSAACRLIFNLNEFQLVD